MSEALLATPNTDEKTYWTSAQCYPTDGKVGTMINSGTIRNPIKIPLTRTMSDGNLIFERVHNDFTFSPDFYGGFQYSDIVNARGKEITFKSVIRTPNLNDTSRIRFFTASGQEISHTSLGCSAYLGTCHLLLCHAVSIGQSITYTIPNDNPAMNYLSWGPTQLIRQKNGNTTEFDAYMFVTQVMLYTKSSNAAYILVEIDYPITYLLEYTMKLIDPGYYA